MSRIQTHWRERMTWILDIDGTILRYCGNEDGKDELLPETAEVWRNIPAEDTIILVTARRVVDSDATEDFLRSNGLRFDHIIYGVGTGARVLFNDTKPDGRITAFAVPVVRDEGVKVEDVKRFL